MMRLRVPLESDPDGGIGWYADVAGVSGDYAVLIQDRHIQTSRGDVPLPGENVLYLRAQIHPETHVLELCGVGGRTDTAWLWNGAQWVHKGPAVGVSACIFNAAGLLEINNGSAGSQGYRYVGDDWKIKTGDETYNDSTPLAQQFGLKRIFEWTRYRDLAIGQADEEKGCLTIGPHGRRILEPGNCRFVRFLRLGTSCAVALWKPLERCAVLLWFQADELASMPVQVETPVAVCASVYFRDETGPCPICGHDKQRHTLKDREEPVIVNLPHAVFVTINAFYDRFGLPEGEEPQRAHQGRCCETVRFHHGDKWGWKRADPNRPPSADAIAFKDGAKMWIWDCVFDAGGPNRRFTLVDNSEGLDVSTQVFIPVAPVDHLAGDVIDPDPGTVPAAVKAYVDAAVMNAEARVMQAVVGLANTAAGVVRGELEPRIRTLEDAPPSEFDPNAYDVKVDVGRAFAHSHSATGKLVKK